jgi:hypothetical protein
LIRVKHEQRQNTDEPEMKGTTNKALFFFFLGIEEGKAHRKKKLQGNQPGGGIPHYISMIKLTNLSCLSWTIIKIHITKGAS